MVSLTAKIIRVKQRIFPASGTTETITPKTPESIPSAEDDKTAAVWLMMGLSFITGVLSGLGAIVFKALISLVHNLFLLGRVQLTYNQDIHTLPCPWGIAVILVPVAGSIMVTWITKTLAPEAKGHGVPEVLNAIYYREGKIRPAVVLAKALASAISIGTGGSVGREGPIIQIGSAIGSLLGQIVSMPARQRVTLIAAGAAAGIAATFNAPVGGLSFAIELLLVSISARTVIYVSIATITATIISRLHYGLAPSFNVPHLAAFEDPLMRLYIVLFSIPLGVLAGGASALFIKSIYGAEDIFAAKLKNEYVRHMAGMFFIGVMMFMFMKYSGHYYTEGVGYATIMDILHHDLSNPAFLALLFIAKLIATDLTLGSGASGGIFSPSLFLGATLGSTFGNLLAILMPSMGIDPAVFAIAGMAGLVAGTTGAILTAIFMTFEQTRDYAAMLPIITTVAISHVVRRFLTQESIYTLKLSRRGIRVPQGLQASVSRLNSAKTLMSTEFRIVDVGGLREWQASYTPGHDPRHTVVVKDDNILGLAQDELLYVLRDEPPEAIIDRNIFHASAETTWAVLMRALRRLNTEKVLVFNNHHDRNPGNLIGVITAREIARNALTGAELID